MAVIAVPAIKWASTPAPHSAAELVAVSSIQPLPVPIGLHVIPTPTPSQLTPPDNGVGYAS